jgi:hypothetical protein
VVSGGRGGLGTVGLPYVLELGRSVVRRGVRVAAVAASADVVVGGLLDPEPAAVGRQQHGRAYPDEADGVVCVVADDLGDPVGCHFRVMALAWADTRRAGSALWSFIRSRC